MKIAEWKETEDFFNRCLQRFGSMNKNDYEVALFHLLLKNEFTNESDHTISLKLRIPESKVKRLRYEESLIYQNEDQDKEYLNELGSMLVNLRYRVQNNRIQFAIADKSLRLFLNDCLMSEGRFADSSFNSNIVSLTADDLLYLLEKTNKKTEKTIQEIKKEINKGNKDLPKTITEILKDFAVGTAKHAIGKIAGDQLNNFLGELKNIIKYSK